MSKLLLATNNHGKLIEIQALLEALNLKANLVTPDQIGLQLKVAEDGETYAENAAKKAVAFAQASGLPTLADDSGLEVDALDGQPGIHSARFAPQTGASDADRRAYLLKQLQGKPRPWTAHFHCTVALLKPDGNSGKGRLQYAEGNCFGEIIPEERGKNGFGYDPIFLLPELRLTMAELPMEQKNRLSHRARAIRAAEPILLEFLTKMQ